MKRNTLNSKMMALLVLALLVLSVVPFALADRDSDNGTGNDDNVTDSDDSTDDVEDQSDRNESSDSDDDVDDDSSDESDSRDREKTRLRMNERDDRLEIRQERLARVDERLQSTAMRIKERMLEPRFITQEKRLEMHDRIVEFRQMVVDAKQSALSERMEFEKAKAEGDDEAAFEHAKKYLTHIADTALAFLEKAKSTVEANEQLSEEQVAERLAEIDALIAQMQDAKDAVDAATTKEEVRAAAKDVLDVWKQVRRGFELMQQKIRYDLIGGVLLRSERLGTHLACIADSVADADTPIEGFDETVDEITALITSADEKHAQAQKLLEEAADLRKNSEPSDERAEQVTTRVKDANALMQEAHKALQDAHAKLQAAMREVNVAGIDISGCRPAAMPPAENSTQSAEAGN